MIDYIYFVICCVFSSIGLALGEVEGVLYVVFDVDEFLFRVEFCGVKLFKIGSLSKRLVRSFVRWSLYLFCFLRIFSVSYGVSYSGGV